MSRNDFRGQKRRFDDSGNVERDGEPNTSKPSVRFNPIEGGRQWTLSIAIPGSILENIKSAEQRMTAPGRIARALAVFSVDEVVVYDDSSPDTRRTTPTDTNSYTGDVDPCHFLAYLLSFLEAPPFMRKHLFPIHPNLRLAGQLPSLDMPHHPHPREWTPFREGLAVAPTTPATKRPGWTAVDVGLPEPIAVEGDVPAGERVTVRFRDGSRTEADAVDPSLPRTEMGYYWGYTVRRAASLSAVFTECPLDGGYDASVGTSERGAPLARALPRGGRAPAFRHLLVVFGGPKGLEYASANDPELRAAGAAGSTCRDLFDYWVNVLPRQGSRTIRTDEAVYIALTGLSRLWEEA